MAIVAARALALVADRSNARNLWLRKPLHRNEMRLFMSAVFKEGLARLTCLPKAARR